MMFALLFSAVFGFLTAGTLRTALYPPPKSDRARFVFWTVIYTLLAGGSFAYLLANGRLGLLWFIIPAAALTVAYFWTSASGSKRTLPFELAGLAGLTLSGPAAVYTQTGAIGPVAGMVYILCLIWFFDRTMTARKVLELIRKGSKATSRAEKLETLKAEIVIHAICLAAAVAVSAFGPLKAWYLALPFLAATFRTLVAVVAVENPSDPMKVGFAEMRLGIIFCAFLVLVFRMQAA